MPDTTCPAEAAREEAPEGLAEAEPPLAPSPCWEARPAASGLGDEALLAHGAGGPGHRVTGAIHRHLRAVLGGHTPDDGTDTLHLGRGREEGVGREEVGERVGVGEER